MLRQSLNEFQLFSTRLNSSQLNFCLIGALPNMKEGKQTDRPIDSLLFKYSNFDKFHKRLYMKVVHKMSVLMAITS